MPTARNSGNRIITITPLHIEADPLSFTSLITQYADTWTPQWRAESVYGRMDPISFYGGTQRHLTLGFRVVSEDESEAKENMYLIQRLIQYQYPSYDTVYNKNPAQAIATLKAPPYFAVKFFNIGSTSSEQLHGYFNAPITIDPGFQDRTKVQYYGDTSASTLLFSDVEIVLQMVVLHHRQIGFYGTPAVFGGAEAAQSGDRYPFDVSWKGGTRLPQQYGVNCGAEEAAARGAVSQGTQAAFDLNSVSPGCIANVQNILNKP